MPGPLFSLPGPLNKCGTKDRKEKGRSGGRKEGRKEKYK